MPLLVRKSKLKTSAFNATRMQAFLAKHPESAKARQLIRSHPVSSGFENSTYNSLNAFRFNNAKGEVVPVRWSMVLNVSSAEDASAALAQAQTCHRSRKCTKVASEPLNRRLRGEIVGGQSRN